MDFVFDHTYLDVCFLHPCWGSWWASSRHRRQSWPSIWHRADPHRSHCLVHPPLLISDPDVIKALVLCKRADRRTKQPIPLPQLCQQLWHCRCQVVMLVRICSNVKQAAVRCAWWGSSAVARRAAPIDRVRVTLAWTALLGRLGWVRRVPAPW